MASRPEQDEPAQAAPIRMPEKDELAHAFNEACRDRDLDAAVAVAQQIGNVHALMQQNPDRYNPYRNYVYYGRDTASLRALLGQDVDAFKSMVEKWSDAGRHKCSFLGDAIFANMFDVAEWVVGRLQIGTADVQYDNLVETICKDDDMPRADKIEAIEWLARHVTDKEGRSLTVHTAGSDYDGVTSLLRYAPPSALEIYAEGFHIDQEPDFRSIWLRTYSYAHLDVLRWLRERYGLSIDSCRAGGDWADIVLSLALANCSYLDELMEFGIARAELIGALDTLALEWKKGRRSNSSDYEFLRGCIHAGAVNATRAEVQAFAGAVSDITPASNLCVDLLGVVKELQSM